MSDTFQPDLFGTPPPRDPFPPKVWPIIEEKKSNGQRKALSAADLQWRENAETALAKLIDSGRTFTADDLIDLVGLANEGVNRNNIIGALFTSYRKTGMIRSTGNYRPSMRISNHGRILAEWIAA